MAKIPQYKQQRLPSTNVGAAPLPMDAANVGAGAIGQGLQQLGAGVSNFADSMFKIEMMHQTNKDNLAMIEYKNIIDEADAEQKAFQKTTGDANLWEENAQMIDERTNYRISQLDVGTDKTRSQMLKTTQGWSKNFHQRNQLAIIEKTQKEALEVTRNDLVNVFAIPITSDMNTAQVQELQERQQASTEMFTQTYKHSFGNDKVALELSSAKIDGLKGQVINMASNGDFVGANKLIESIPFSDPKDRVAMQNSISAMQKNYEKENRNNIEALVNREVLTEAAKNGWESAEAMLDNPKTILKFTNAGLDRKEARSLLSDIRERVTSEKNKTENLSVKNRDTSINETYIKIANNKEDLTSSINGVDSWVDVLPEDKIIAKDKIKSFYNAIHSSQIYNPTSAIAIRQDFNKFMKGEITQSDMMESFIKHSPSLESGIRNSILDDIFNTKSMSPVLKNGIGRLQKNLLDMWNAEVITEGQYNKYHGDIFKWATEHPEATDKQLTEALNGMIAGDKKSWLSIFTWVAAENAIKGVVSGRHGRVIIPERKGMNVDFVMLGDKKIKVGEGAIGQDGKYHTYEGNGIWSK